MTAYYNEFDPKAAAWLRELISRGLIAPGEVDERSIEDVRPTELMGYTQCHFFAGIGGWSYALRLAGWPDDRPVWTGSCPCQPFSQAGNGDGDSDERHLWPAWYELIKQCRPSVIFGEQVSSVLVIGQKGEGPRVPNALSTGSSRQGFDSARSQESAEEELGIRLGSTCLGDTESHRFWGMRSVGPLVQLGWWEDVGQPVTGSNRPSDGLHDGQCPCGLCGREQRAGGLGRGPLSSDSEGNHGQAAGCVERALRAYRAEFDAVVGGVWSAGVYTDLEQAGYAVGSCNLAAAGIGAPHIRQRLFWLGIAAGERPQGEQQAGAEARTVDGTRASGWLPKTNKPERDERPRSGEQPLCDEDGGDSERLADSDGERCGRARKPLPDMDQHAGKLKQRGDGEGQANGWIDYSLIRGADGKARRIKSGIEPLVDGVPARMVRLRGYGNAIVPQVAAGFIVASMTPTTPPSTPTAKGEA